MESPTYKSEKLMNATNPRKIVVIGLGYVGLPLAIELSRHFEVIGFDIDDERIAELRSNHDRTNEVQRKDLASSSLCLADTPAECSHGDVYILTVPTPVSSDNRPDLRLLIKATEMVATLLDATHKPIVVYESTVYPGVTEDVCGPIIERVSGLRRGRDFFLGYSPERVNPGDREHTLARIVKVVAGENSETTECLAALYGKLTTAGVFRAASIKVAEAAKVIENAQRDINIAFMNEVAQIFAKLDISTLDVLAAARTKWNFLPFHPGLVGGHCIGVDPYYLSHCAQSLGYLPRVVLAGRSINDTMGVWVADAIHSRRRSETGTALILGTTFKEDVPDMRNSKVIDVARRLKWLGHDVTLHDPLADPEVARENYGLSLDPSALDRSFDVVLLCVPHESYREMPPVQVEKLVEAGGLLADLHGVWRDQPLNPTLDRWSL